MSKAQNVPHIALALQGGGAHGAFTWGVLLRLLEEMEAGKIHITAISGTSAGAMNGAVLAEGLVDGGPAAAREKLSTFWETVSHYSAFNPYSAAVPALGRFNPLARLWDVMLQFISPYQLNPLNINPLRAVLEKTIDFERLRSCKELQLYVSATNVRTNRLRVFSTPHMTADVLLASACLPHLYQAVEVDGDMYWDGGYMGNPVLEPLLAHHERDVLIVQTSPTQRTEVPQSAWDILDRVNEITFNASLMREIRTISHLDGQDGTPDMRLHLIDSGGVFPHSNVHSKYNTHYSHLTALRDKGYQQAENWLAENKGAIGQRTTLDLSDWKPVWGDFAAGA